MEKRDEGGQHNGGNDRVSPRAGSGAEYRLTRGAQDKRPVRARGGSPALAALGSRRLRGPPLLPVRPIEMRLCTYETRLRGLGTGAQRRQGRAARVSWGFSNG